MTTPTHLPFSSTTLADRLPLRLRLEPRLGEGALDGSWWPQSRDPSVELADLVDNFPAQLGQVQRVVFSRPDWDAVPRRVRVARGQIKVGSYPRDDMSQVWLSMSTHTMIRLSVVTFDGPSQSPTVPGPTAPSQAAANEHPDEQLEADPYWNDEGEHWWAPHSVAPSERT
jgi:Family of unknown function (DUF5994)